MSSFFSSRWVQAPSYATEVAGGGLPKGFRAAGVACGIKPDGTRDLGMVVSDSPATADPLRRYDTLWNQRPLDLATMNEAAQLLLGEHDFAAFCRKREGATTIRALRQLSWERAADGVAVGTVVADAFCHNMVRALVGALISVGEGTRPATWPVEVLKTMTRDPNVRVAAAHGLSLEEVRYPDDAQLAARAALTRRVRVAEDSRD